MENYDILIYMVNWPDVRQNIWKNLLVSRAIENQSYCIGVNRTRHDGNGISYSGESAVIMAEGVANFMDINEQIKTFELSWSKLYNFKTNFLY